MEVEHDEQEIIERVAALDIGKAELVCCVRVPGPGRRRRMQEVRTYSTMTRSLLADGRLAGRAGGDPGGDGGDQRLLEAAVLPAGGRVRDVAGQRQGRQAPARTAQDRPVDAVWLCKVAERQMLRPSFVPPEPIRRCGT